jgi:site-specific recombinase XerC
MARPLVQLFARWLGSLKHERGLALVTISTWRCYCTAHWQPFFVDADGFTRQRFGEYVKQRLRHVQKATVKKERTALRGFLVYALTEGDLEPPPYAPPAPEDPDQRESWATDVVDSWVPRLPKRGLGTPYKHRRRVASFDLSPEQTRDLIRALPEWSTSKRVGRFPVRARFIVAYETSLRPSTLDRMLAPKHYRPGSDRLQLTADIDKARFARPTPLTKRAQRVLDYVLRCHGPGYTGHIFGAHDYRQHLARAAKKALPPELAEKFAGTHLRAHAITHWLEKGSNMLGVQQMAGHKQIATTSRYAKPSFRAAEAAIGRR